MKKANEYLLVRKSEEVWEIALNGVKLKYVFNSPRAAYNHIVHKNTKNTIKYKNKIINNDNVDTLVNKDKKFALDMKKVYPNLDKVIFNVNKTNDTIKTIVYLKSGVKGITTKHEEDKHERLIGFFHAYHHAIAKDSNKKNKKTGFTLPKIKMVKYRGVLNDVLNTFIGDVDMPLDEHHHGLLNDCIASFNNLNLKPYNYSCSCSASSD